MAQDRDQCRKWINCPKQNDTGKVKNNNKKIEVNKGKINKI